MLAGVTPLGALGRGLRRSMPLRKGCSRDTRASQAHAPPPPLHHPGAKFQSGLANTMSARDVWPVPLTETHGHCFSATGQKHGCQEFCRAREEGPPLPCACPRAAESGHQQRNSAGSQLRRRAMPVASRALLILTRRIPSLYRMHARQRPVPRAREGAKPPSRARGTGRCPVGVPSEAPPPGCAAHVVTVCVCAARCACRAARAPAASCAQGPPDRRCGQV
jgi:hypothetical protein